MNRAKLHKLGREAMPCSSQLGGYVCDRETSSTSPSLNAKYVGHSLSQKILIGLKEAMTHKR